MRWPVRGMRLIGVGLVAGGVAPAAAQRLPTQSAAVGGEERLSPSAMVSWFGRPGAEGATALELAVVWRGRAGWLAPGIRGRSTFAMPTRTIRNGSGQARTIPGHPARAEYTAGPVSFGVEYDPATGVATLLGRRVVLSTDNVILVDGMGEPGGPKVMGTARVATTLPHERRAPIAPLLRASPRVAAFLR